MIIISSIGLVLLCCLPFLAAAGSSYTFGKNIGLVEGSQYHFVPGGGYLALLFSKDNITSNKFQEAKLTANLNITIVNQPANNSLNYDFLAFSSINPIAAAQFSCYQNSIELNISSMTNCSMVPSISNCSVCIQNCFNGLVKQNSCCCINCTNEQLVLINNTQFNKINSSQLVMVLDNSNFLGPYNEAIPSMALIVGYNLDIDLNEEYQIMLYIIVGLMLLLLIIMIVTFFWLNRKVKYTEGEIKVFQKNSSSIKEQ